MRRLDILIPVYNEPVSVLKTLLDSIALQQNVDFDQIGVIICCDGGSLQPTEEFLKQYPFNAEFHICEHKGVSATRQACVDYSAAEYVCWCDVDDMFYNMCGLWILFREFDMEDPNTKIKGFDSLMSAFVEETRNPQNKDEIVYINHDKDSTFVHGKVHRRLYLINNNIKWNPKLTIHEDSYFNILCQSLSKNVKYCQTPFYLWRWRDESVCRHDPKYILKTYNNMLESNTALIHEFLNRNMREQAQFYSVFMVFDAYYTMNKKEWLDQENQNYRHAVELRFKQYWTEFKDLYNSITEDARNQIIVNVRNRMFQEGMFIESITFNDWIKIIEDLEE